MSPFRWERRHRMAMLIAALIGAAMGVVLGYIVYGVAQGADGGSRFGVWLEHPVRFGWPGWAIFGGAIGAGAAYVRRLLSN